jgi:ribosomal protein S18 acetylase RimI-like enzyme
MRIEYVEVSPELRGTGLGKQLVEKSGRVRERVEASSCPDLFVRTSCDPS